MLYFDDQLLRRFLLYKKTTENVTDVIKSLILRFMKIEPIKRLFFKNKLFFWQFK